MNTFSNLTPFLKTIEERNLLLSELQFVQQTFFSTDQSQIEEVFGSRVRHQVATILQQLFSDEDRQEIFTRLESYLHDLEVVHMVIAFEPTQDQIEYLAMDIKLNEDTPRLLEIEIDPSIVGGMKLAIAGKYADFSLRKKITEYWQEHQSEIIAKLFDRDRSEEHNLEKS